MARAWIPLVLTGAVLASGSFVAGRYSAEEACLAAIAEQERGAQADKDFMRYAPLPETGNRRF